MGGTKGCIKRTGAYLTVYLTLILTIILSLCLTLIEGTRRNAVYMEAECVTDIGLNSIFAEYHRELFRQYNLFAIDSSYGSSLPQVNLTCNHLEEYIGKNLSMDDVFLDWLLYRDLLGMKLEDIEMTKVSFMTDDKGSIFRKRAAEAVWDDMSLNLYDELKGWMYTVESKQLTERDIAAEKMKLDKKLKKYDGKEKQVSETEWVTVKVKNPTDALEKKRKEGIFTWAVANPSGLSDKSLNMNDLIMARMNNGNVNQGNMRQDKVSTTDKALERFFFQEYLMRYMGHYGTERDESALSYQIEYLIAGKNNDMDNLRSVVSALLAIREVANTVYILSDQNKCMTAETLGYLLASAMLIPEAGDLIKLIILFGWAYAESIYDVKTLLAGGKIPLMKDASTWHYDLDAALSLGNNSKITESKGLSYEDYLRIMLMLQNEDTLTARAMNMVEADIRLTAGNEYFRLDGCIDAVEACVRIKSAYGYSCEITRQKGYSTQ